MEPLVCSPATAFFQVSPSIASWGGTTSFLEVYLSPAFLFLRGKGRPDTSTTAEPATPSRLLAFFFAAFPCLLGLDPCWDSLPCNIYVCALILLHRYILQTNSGEGKKTWGEQFARNISGRVYGTPADSRPLCRRTTSTSRIFTAPRSC